jgi:hypothetical protein
MPLLHLLGFALCLLVGVSLGLLGGGGSILTVPVLVYALGVEPRAAVGMSLAVVGATAAAGAVQHRRRGAVRGRAGALFAAAGVVTALAGSRLTYRVPPRALLAIFGALMVGVAVWMLARRAGPAATSAGEAPREARPGSARALAAGAGVGFLTGFLGVGGGFLVVPALVLFAGLAMREAVGTSLLVIAINCAAGLAGHLTAGGFDLRLTLVVTALAVAGSFAGTALAHRLRPEALGRAFALLVLAVGVLLLAGNLGPQG